MATSDLAAVIVVVIGLLGTSCSLCGDTLVSQSAAPSGDLVATVYDRDCGAMTGFVRHVSLHRRWQSFDGAFDELVVSAEGQPQILLDWRSASELRVTVSRGAEVFRRTPSARGVRIDIREE
jgi:hypothetical protein